MKASRTIRLLVAGVLGAALTVPVAASAADSTTLSARKRHHSHQRHHHGNSAAAMRMFGMMAGTIMGIAAAEQEREYWRDRSYYGYPPPPRYRYYPYRRYYPY